ncbi:MULTISPECIES: sensor histidine kinase [unclassified Microbacterium]|uniref:sensor histidine kinase n=1 Tax=unclassified Microbacterium TaxID=2609290 RepID=UPI00374688C2
MEQQSVTAARSEPLTSTDLLRCLAHDLRQPIAAASLALSELARADGGSDPATRAELVDIADRGIETIARLVDQLLDMTRVVDAALRVHREPMDVTALLLEGVAELRLGPDSIRLDFPDTEAVVVGDPALLLRAIVNILSNAHRHSPANRAVLLRFREDQGRALVSIIDHGPGVPAGDRENIFGQYWRGGPAGHSGLGLGLYLSRTFVELMGGTIVACETPGGGLTVHLTLPWE